MKASNSFLLGWSGLLDNPLVSVLRILDVSVLDALLVDTESRHMKRTNHLDSILLGRSRLILPLSVRQFVHYHTTGRPYHSFQYNARHSCRQ